MVTLYILGAMLATAINIASQEAVLRLTGNENHVFLSIAVGTITGLAVKYVWDKRFIFNYRTESLTQDAAKFSAYSLMGVFTTGIFWATEFGFDLLFQTKEMRYLGGVLGLAVGYTVKFYLDRRFVFRD